MKNKTHQQPKSIYTNPTLVIQYELSKNYMEYARDQLLPKEIQLMIESNLLIEKLATSSCFKTMENGDKDWYKLGNSKTLDTLATQQDEQPKIKQRPFTRKSANGKQLTGIDQGIQQALEQIRENCSMKAFSCVSNLVQMHGQLIKSVNQIKPLQHQSSSKYLIKRSKVDNDRNGNDQAIILVTKNMKLEKENNMLQAKIKQLEDKIEVINEKCKKEEKQQTSEIFGYIKEYFDNREKRMNDYSSHLENYHKGIAGVLQGIIVPESCTRCCELVKKIKGSLINYKECLAEEIEYYKELWYSLYIKNKQTKIEIKNENKNTIAFE